MVFMKGLSDKDSKGGSTRPPPEPVTATSSTSPLARRGPITMTSLSDAAEPSASPGGAASAGPRSAPPASPAGIARAGEAWDLARRAQHEVLDRVREEREAILARERKAELLADLRERYARWGRDEAYRDACAGRRNPHAGIDIQSLLEESERTVLRVAEAITPVQLASLRRGDSDFRWPATPGMLDEQVRTIKDLEREQSHARRERGREVRWKNFAWAAGVFVAGSVLGNLATFFSFLGVLGAISLVVSPLQDLLSRSAAGERDRSLQNRIDTQRGNLGYCLDQWVEAARSRSAEQRAEAGAERERAAAELALRFTPLATGLQRESEALFHVGGFACAGWKNPAWRDWSPAAAPAPAVRLGTLTFQDPESTAFLGVGSPPLSFVLPALLPLHRGRALLLTAQRDGLGRAVTAVQGVVTRLLATLPPGRLYLTFLDPAGLGNNVSLFLGLGEHLPALVNTRAWSDPTDIERLLGELVERIEGIVQRCIPNPEESIEDYNARAGDLAEPYRVVVALDFPRHYTDTAARRLTRIAHHGPRCGVYPLVVRDINLKDELPYRFNPKELEDAAYCIDQQADGFIWRDTLLGRGTLELDPAPLSGLTERIVKTFGPLARGAEQVEVPFPKLLELDGLTPSKRWSWSAVDGLRIPLGLDGAGRVVSLAVDNEVGAMGAQHALLAGATSMGKSTLLHTLVTAGTLAYPPEELELYLVDLRAGVEFITYAEMSLPHARVIAVDDDPDYGLSVIEGLAGELADRGKRFREAGVANYRDYREKTRTPLPRVLLIVDEFQVLFPSSDAALTTRAATLLEHLARQGRGVGIHLLLCSQTIGRSDALTSTTMDQMRIRIALGCSDADARRLLGDDNLGPARYTRKGQALYNPAQGLKEHNREFQVALCGASDRTELRTFILDRATKDKGARPIPRRAPQVFVGSEPASLPACEPLGALLAEGSWPVPRDEVKGWLGEPVAMKPPIAASFLPEAGRNLLVVTREEEQAMGVLFAALLSIAAQRGPEHAAFVVLDLSRAGTAWAGLAERVKAALPHSVEVGASRHLPHLLKTLAALLEKRVAADRALPLHVYWLVLGLHRARALHDPGHLADPSEESRQMLEILKRGPELGMHVLAWCDSVRNLGSVRDAAEEMRLRVAGPMEEGDSSRLIDSPAASRLKANRMVYVDRDDPDTMLQFRPYALPDADWIAASLGRLKSRA